MADLARCRRLLAGTDPPGPGPWPEPDEGAVDAAVARALIEGRRRDHPPPPLDRLGAGDLAEFRARPPRGR